MQCKVLADTNTVQVFRLAGFRGEIAETPEAARVLLKEMLNIKDLGLLIVTEKIAGYIGEEDMAEAEISRHFPLILTIPDREGHRSDAEDIIKKVKKHIGIKV